MTAFTFRKCYPHDAPSLTNLATTALATDAFYRVVFGFTGDDFEAYWRAYISMVLADPFAEVYALEEDGRLWASAILGHAGFPSADLRATFLLGVRQAIDPTRMSMFADFLDAYEEVMALPGEDLRGEAQLLWLFVEPTRRGTGLPEIMFDAWARSHRRPVVTTLSCLANANAPHLLDRYRGLGFQVQSTRELLGTRFVRMTRVLDLVSSNGDEPENSQRKRAESVVHWYDRFEAIPPDGRIVAQDQLGPAWPLTLFGAQEACHPTNIQPPRYAVAYEDGAPVGWVATCVVTLEHSVVTRGKSLRIVSLGDAMGYALPSIAVAHDHIMPARVHESLFRATIDYARNIQADAVYVCGLPQDAAALLTGLTRAGLCRCQSSPWAFVPLAPERLGAYPAALRSSYRRGLRRKQELLVRHDLRIIDGAEGLTASHLFELYERMAEKKMGEEASYSDLRYRHTEAFFSYTLSDPTFRYQSVRTRDGGVLAYNLGVKSTRVFQSLVVGMATDELTRLGGKALPPAVYLALHAGVIGRAEADGCTWVNLGTDALEAKARLGAVFRHVDEADLALTRDYSDLIRLLTPTSTELLALPRCRPYGDIAMTTIETIRRSLESTGCQNRK